MTTINLLPKSYVKQQSQNRVDMLCVVLFAMVMGGLMLAEHSLNKKYGETLVLHRTINNQFAAEEKFLEGSFRLQARKNVFLEEARTISAVIQKEESIPRSYVLAAITKACPLDVSLDKMKIEMARATGQFVQNDEGKSKSKKKPSRVKRRGNPVTSMILLAEKRSGRTINETLPHIMVRIEGQSKSDKAIAKFYSDLKANPLFELCVIEIAQDHKKLDLKDRKFQIWLVLKRGIDVKKLLEQRDQERQKPETDTVTGGSDG